MDNYKIKVKDEAESKEAQELFFELGYKWNGTGKQYFWVTSGKILAYSTGVLFQLGDESGQELTLPQLRDLVVLKRNDVKDENYRSTKVSDGRYFKTCDGKFYFMFEGSWVLSEINTDEGLEPITQDQSLIRGAEALRALADGEKVEASTECSPTVWEDAANYSANEFLAEETAETDDYCSMKLFFRLKPATLTVNAELPKPSNTTLHNQNYSVTYEFSSRDERNAFVEGLGGNNS